MRRLYFPVHRDLPLGTHKVTFGFSKDSDALIISIFNPKNALQIHPN